MTDTHEPTTTPDHECEDQAVEVFTDHLHGWECAACGRNLTESWS